MLVHSQLQLKDNAKPKKAKKQVYQPKVRKLFRKYSEAFVERLLINLLSRSEDLNLQAVLQILSALQLTVMRRDNLRLALEFALRAVPVLEEARLSLDAQFDQFLVQFFTLSKRFCLHENDKKVLISEIYRVCQVDPEEVAHRLSPLGVKADPELKTGRVELENDSEGEASDWDWYKKATDENYEPEVYVEKHP